ncbi:MAG: hypothetical protein N0E59_01960 [Candidatus Thiodiazotropha taylori]|nr:hypothetical protein [Candidatus Thiodiazotropha taylori]MCG8092620.1 hypothetical protein [Candidatus Thiodiazotropha endolucinida]MCG8109506.1 hypothetical protein [Candidatus Thiodiazotropha taylori]MCW4281847.1 hypothetical protein [Candidatus Thiodiazotropha taylori]MCW4305959.1 hypothetical protein [Candidatus Thiodiazotropha taylori]
MKAIAVFLLLFISTSSFASIFNRPSKDDSYLALLNYSYIYEPKVIGVRIHIVGDASKFVSESSIFRYLKLKFRNFIQEYKLVEISAPDIPENRNYMRIIIRQNKYNDKMDVYTGLTSMEIFPRYADTQHRPYQIITPESGSDTQIEGFIKSSIDQMVELFAEDYYLIGDFKKEKKKEINKQPKEMADEDYFK